MMRTVAHLTCGSISAPMDDRNHPRFEVLNTVTFAEHGGKTTLT